jgi:hypothetical protein
MHRLLLIAIGLTACLPAFSVAGSEPSLTLEIKDYVELPITGKLDGTGQSDGMLARMNSLREEPGGANRLFINDVNGPMYIIDKATRKLTTYLDFNGREGHTGLFHKFTYETGWANGLIGLQFDPDYRRNGRFYTVHIEDPELPGSPLPDNAHLPGLVTRGYETSTPIKTPGPTLREAVVIEWTDTNTSNTTFEGTAREIMRLQLNARIHPIGDLMFNPSAKSGDAEWRVLYIGSGDSGSGESRTGIRSNPQRLDTMVGKILRIIPDLAEHPSASVVSDNGRYRIPNDNPFVSLEGARKEIWAYGFRNPHRLHFAIDPADARNNRLVVDSVGLHTWETINIVHEGANYGYSAREGNSTLKPDNQIVKQLPENDTIPVMVTDTITHGTVTPTYPVLQYGHVPGGGDAIGAGFLYNGKLIPALRGKYIFTDVTTGRIWYADYKELLAADDGNPDTMAERHEIRIRWNNPHDTQDAGPKVYDTMFPIAEAAYQFRGGKDPDLPGVSLVSGKGRADAQLGVDAAGELYILTKTDGVLRAVVGETIR